MKRIVIGICLALVTSIGCFDYITSLNEELNKSIEKIAFHSDRDGNYEIYIMNPDGSGQTRLTFSSDNDRNPSFSADGSRIAYDTDDSYIIIMNINGSNSSNIGGGISPRWSPDGSRIAFHGWRAPYTDIAVINIDGTGLTWLTSDGNSDYSPSWSPDGKYIVFERMLTLDFEIYYFNVSDNMIDPSNDTLLVASGGVDRHPSWSPDGSHIAFMSDRSGNSQIYVLDFASPAVQTIITSTGNNDYPSWSPDGTRIVFVSDRDDPNGDIYIMNADGTDVKRLTNNTFHDSVPCWGFIRASRQ